MSYQDIIPRLSKGPKVSRMHIPSPTERYHLLAHVFFFLVCPLLSTWQAVTWPSILTPQKSCHNPPDSIRPTPRFSSPVPGPEIKEKERRLLE